MFSTLKSTDPISVATAFFHAMHEFDKNHHPHNDIKHEFIHTHSAEISSPNSNQERNEDVEENNIDGSSPKSPTLLSETNESTPTNKNQFLTEFYHVLQFCFLCYKGKITPVLYTIDKSSETTNWFSNLVTITFNTNCASSKQLNNIDNNSDSDNETINPIHKMS
jgi:hypothetical protein